MTLVPLRDRLQLERRALDGPILVTLFGEVVWRQVAERAMRAAMIVVDAPRKPASETPCVLSSSSLVSPLSRLFVKRNRVKDHVPSFCL